MKTVLRWALLFFLGTVILLSGASCGVLGLPQAWKPPRPVAMKGGTREMICFNSFPSWEAWMTDVPEGGTGGLLVLDRDIIFAGTSDSSPIHGFVYKQSDGASLELREEDGRLLLSGKTISIAPEGIESYWEWLDRASSDDLRSLRFLMLPEDLDEHHLSTLKKLAAVNPDLGLEIESTSGWKSAAALFKPRILCVGSFEGSSTATDIGGFFRDQKQIETLVKQAQEEVRISATAATPPAGTAARPVGGGGTPPPKTA